MLVDPSLLSAEALTKASVILAVGLLLFFSSMITICILMRNPNLHDVIGFYLISLAFGDLICASFIIPLSIYSSLAPNWNFFGDDSMLCKCSSYVQIVLLSSTIYTYAWISVDRYSAFMKPSRYECEHTSTRCKCWIMFSWITAILLSLPMIIAKMEVNYYPEFELCVLNWSSTLAYSITLGVLVLFPSICTLVFTSFSIFLAMRKPEELEDSQRSIVETDPNFIVTLFVLISFILAWLPIVVIQFLPTYLIHPADSATMKFAFIWLAIGGSAAKLLIYLFTNKEFRKTFCSLCFRLGPSISYGENGVAIDPDDYYDEDMPSSYCCCCCFPKHNQSTFVPPVSIQSLPNNQNNINQQQQQTNRFVNNNQIPEYGSFAQTISKNFF